MKKILFIFMLFFAIAITGCSSDDTPDGPIVIKEIKLELVKCPAGTFMMGSTEGELARKNDEKQHNVTLTKPFYIGKFEVTQSQYEAIIGKNPSKFIGANNPVEMVSYEESKAFCDKLNTKYLSLLPKGYKFDLPTEAQWEYACRAGTNTRFNNGTDKDIDEVAWYDKSASDTTHIVGQKKPNAWGIYDMHGNVCEWCRDWYGEYPNEDVKDPIGASSGSDRVNRGGGWDDGAYSCRSADRCRDNPSDVRSKRLGFRVAIVPVE